MVRSRRQREKRKVRNYWIGSDNVCLLVRWEPDDIYGQGAPSYVWADVVF